MKRSLSFLLIVVVLLSNFLFSIEKTYATSPGSLAQTFELVPSSTIRAIRIQDDGKILIAGDFSTLNGDTYNRIARLNTDGTIDGDFNIGTGFGATVRNIRLLPDGDIVASGNFTTYNNTGASRTVRLNSDGSIDGGYVYGSGFSATTYSNTVDSNGKYLYVGNFGSYNGSATAAKIARINSDGTLDTPFASGFGNYPYAIEEQADEKLLVAGQFTSAVGTTTGRIARINSDGTLDESFHNKIGAGANSTVWVVEPLNSGKILVAGQFTTFNGVNTTGLIVLNSDGSTDTDFMTNIGTGLSSVIYHYTSVKELSDGRIILAGNFTSFNGTSAPSVIMLNSDGTIDESFDASQALDGAQTIYPIEVDDDEEYLYIGGSLNLVGTGALSGVVKLYLDSAGGGDSPDPGALGGGSSSSISAYCKPSDRTISEGDKVSFDIDIDTTEDSYTFKWTKVLSGNDEDETHTFNQAGKFYPRAEVKDTAGNVDVVNCGTITVEESDEEEEDNDTDEEDTENTPTDTTNTTVRDLELGDTGEDVKLLQKLLNYLGYTLALSGPGSPKNETTIFGFLTRSALAKYQLDNNITPSVGYFGPKTRAHLKSVVNEELWW